MRLFVDRSSGKNMDVVEVSSGDFAKIMLNQNFLDSVCNVCDFYGRSCNGWWGAISFSISDFDCLKSRMDS